MKETNMKKVDKLVKEIKDAEKAEKRIIAKIQDKFDELHDTILSEILRLNLFKKMSWRVSHRQHDFPGIDSIDADKDDTWKVIEKMLGKSNDISYRTHIVHLTDYISIDMEGQIVTLAPRVRETKMQREPKWNVLGDPDNRNGYLNFMNASLLEFVRKYELKVDFTQALKVKERLLNDLNSIERVIDFGIKLNKEKA